MQYNHTYDKEMSLDMVMMSASWSKKIDMAEPESGASSILYPLHRMGQLLNRMDRQFGD